jgi:peptidyl-prolyl cis-trans isomerase SurA
MVPEFDGWMFGLRPGTLSPVIETAFGFHIIRVDRVKPGEVKASHILIRWKTDPTQVAAAKVEADSVLAAWVAGANIDTLTIKHHDPREEKGALQPFPRDSLPPSYASAFSGKAANAFVGPFSIEDRANGSTKYVVAQILSYSEGGQYALSDVRGMLRDQLAQERSIRRLLDGFRKQTYVSIRL